MYWPNGNLAEQGAYADGQRVGTWRRWYSGGEPMEEGDYDAGRPVGQWSSWTPSGVELPDTDYGDGDAISYVHFASLAAPAPPQGFVCGNALRAYYAAHPIEHETCPREVRRRFAHYADQLRGVLAVDRLHTTPVPRSMRFGSALSSTAPDYVRVERLLASANAVEPQALMSATLAGCLRLVAREDPERAGSSACGWLVLRSLRRSADPTLVPAALDVFLDAGVSVNAFLAGFLAANDPRLACARDLLERAAAGSSKASRFAGSLVSAVARRARSLPFAEALDLYGALHETLANAGPHSRAQALLKHGQWLAAQGDAQGARWLLVRALRLEAARPFSQGSQHEVLRSLLEVVPEGSVERAHYEAWFENNDAWRAWWGPYSH